MFGRVWWPLPRWRVGREFRWGIRPVSLLILYFFSDIRFHIESTDGPEEEDQEDGMFIGLTCILWMPDIAFWTTHHFPRSFLLQRLPITQYLDFTEGYEMDQDESSLHCYASAEEPLSPIIRMERFMLSDIIVNRWVSRSSHVWGKLCLLPASSLVFSMLS